MIYDKSYEDILETFRTKGKKILKADCITQIFPEDGAFMQVLPVDEYKSVGAILEPNRDIPVYKTWSLIPVIQIHGHPSSKLADYATIKEYLEEIIVCCKSCFAAHNKTRTDDQSVSFAVSCGSQDLWIGHNFMQVFNSMQNQWDVECIGIDSNPNNCLVDLTERGQVIYRSSNKRHETRDKNLWGYGTNPEYEVYSITTLEVKLQQYVEDNSGILKRSFWAKRNLGVVLVNFDNSTPKLIFIDKSTLAVNLPSNIASDALNFLNSNGKLYGKSEGLILIAKLGNDYSIQDYPLHGRDVGLPHLVE